jgi:RHS repeat-associated protein
VKTPTSGPTQTLLAIAHIYNGFGALASTTDAVNATGPLSLSNAYEYDDAGRLESANWTGDGSGSIDCESLATNDDCFDYDIYGNLLEKGGLLLEYEPPKIHQVIRHGPEGSSALELDYDLAGRRTERVAGAVTEVYTYNALGHLTRTSYGPNAQSATDFFDYQYDYRGQRVYKRETRQGSPQPILRTFSPYADDQGSGWRTKYYFFGDRLVAARQTTAAFTQTWPGSYGPLDFELPEPVVYGALGLVVLLLVAPTRRRGSVLAPARAAGLIVVLLGGSWPTRAAACSQPPPQDSVTHYHLDQLGSILLVTGGADAAVFQQKRYDAYGNVRFRQNGDGTTADATERFRHEYTAWQTDVGTSLHYAGARYFDPAVGQFTTHDPVHQYASPYALGPADPLNTSDRTGATTLPRGGSFDINISITLGRAGSPDARVGLGGGVLGSGSVHSPTSGTSIGGCFGNSFQGDEGAGDGAGGVEEQPRRISATSGRQRYKSGATGPFYNSRRERKLERLA